MQGNSSTAQRHHETALAHPPELSRLCRLAANRNLLKLTRSSRQTQRNLHEALRYRVVLDRAQVDQRARRHVVLGVAFSNKLRLDIRRESPTEDSFEEYAV